MSRPMSIVTEIKYVLAFQNVGEKNNVTALHMKKGRPNTSYRQMHLCAVLQLGVSAEALLTTTQQLRISRIEAK